MSDISIPFSKMDPEVTILQITSSNLALFKNTQKYIGFLNNALMQQPQPFIYLETFLNGLMYIYRNFEAFSAANIPLTPSALKKLRSSDKKGAEFFIKNVLNESNFPKEGIFAYFKCVYSNPNQMLTILREYFESYKEPNIIIKEIPENTLEINFIAFDALCLYLQRISRFFESFF